MSDCVLDFSFNNTDLGLVNNIILDKGCDLTISKMQAEYNHQNHSFTITCVLEGYAQSTFQLSVMSDDLSFYGWSEQVVSLANHIVANELNIKLQIVS